MDNPDTNRISPPPGAIAGSVPLTASTLLFDFPDAMRKVLEGHRISRFSWDPLLEEYGILADGFLTLHQKDGFHKWLVNDGDMEGTDWMVYQGSGDN